ncbi:phosphonate dehydrogenase [Aquabacterium sp. A7-Y]|uniref:phosphonate dehydrogenase n=1 Tax=Aquabacterium sp. A7-Y TaxID=1349605 RepID=UPI00223E8011|nr:phosphonate dehydrogenase [Aquabacterium sp. A7-Y]MCW7539457.1 phosphonate dehydrogenase [Aquabacterium sp. A7-Y]
MKPRLVITHRVHPEIIDLLSPHCELVVNDSADTWPADEVLRRAQSADALMAFMPDRIDAAFLARCPRLKIIGAALKGYDNFDVDACSARGVWLSFVPDLLTVPTAELAIGLCIGLMRRVGEAGAWVRSGRFAGWRPEFYGTGLANSTVGIVGMGAIGQALAQRLKGWDAQLLYTDRHPLPDAQEQALGVQHTTLDHLLTEADLVLLALTLHPGTLHLLNATRLQRMKPGAFLVNPCRGSVVDEAAVLDALRSGRLAGYAADVFEMEDWARPDRPRRIDPELLAHPRSLLTPHIGSAVGTVRLAIERRAAHNILQALRGEVPQDALNRPRAPARTAG